MSKTLMIFLFIFSLIKGKEVSTIYKEDKDGISLCMVGDLLMHRNLTNYAYNEKTDSYNFNFMFENIEEYIKQYDMKVINEEVLIVGRKYGVSDYPKFNSPFELSEAVVKSGFNIILKATNYINYLKGTDAIKDDLNNWKTNYPNVLVIGAYTSEKEYNKITFFEKNGIKIALLNYCYGTNIPLKNIIQ